jgi:hypothetical protein
MTDEHEQDPAMVVAPVGTPLPDLEQQARDLAAALNAPLEGVQKALHDTLAGFTQHGMHKLPTGWEYRTRRIMPHVGQSRPGQKAQWLTSLGQADDALMAAVAQFADKLGGADLLVKHDSLASARGAIDAIVDAAEQVSA